MGEPETKNNNKYTYIIIYGQCLIVIIKHLPSFFTSTFLSTSQWSHLRGLLSHLRSLLHLLRDFSHLSHLHFLCSHDLHLSQEQGRGLSFS
jgi:hypothetical protein